MMGDAKKFVEIINNMIQEKQNNEDTSVPCRIFRVNDNGTYDVAILPDTDNIITNVTNQTPYTFKSGDMAQLFLIKNKTSNSFIIAKHNPQVNKVENSKEENKESFPQVKYEYKYYAGTNQSSFPAPDEIVPLHMFDNLSVGIYIITATLQSTRGMERLLRLDLHCADKYWVTRGTMQAGGGLSISMVNTITEENVRNGKNFIELRSYDYTGGSESYSWQWEVSWLKIQEQQFL